MIFNKNMLKADIGKELKFKNDIGYINDYGDYIFPEFFAFCFPSSEINSIDKAKEIFEEISYEEKLNYINECRMKLRENEE